MATQTQGVVRKSLDPLSGVSVLIYPRSGWHTACTVLVPVRGCPHVLRHASITRTAPRRRRRGGKRRMMRGGKKRWKAGGGARIGENGMVI